MGLIHRQVREVACNFMSDLIILNGTQRQILPAEKFPGNRQKNHQIS